MYRLPVSRQTADFLHKALYEIHCYRIYAVVVVSVFRKIAFYIEIYGYAFFVSDRLYFCVFYRRERVCDYREPSYAAAELAHDVLVHKSHLGFFVVILIMHIMDDVHRFVVNTGDFCQYLLVVAHYFFEVQCVAG